MSSQMFTNINDTFLIRDNVSRELLTKCLNFVTNQRNLKRSKAQGAYKKNTSKSIKIPKTFDHEKIDIIIKTKYNKDFKFININKSLIFNEYNPEYDKLVKKINKYGLDKIKFFPKTYKSKNIVFQDLALGNFYRPEKLADFKSDLLSIIAEVINQLSSKNKNKNYISSYVSKFKFSKKKDPLNLEILNNFNIFINNNLEKKIITSLTHGDFKFEHLFILENNLEYLVDWENVGLRSVSFDLLNFFTPWFVKRSYNYLQIKKFIFEFTKDYLPNLKKEFESKFDIYFCIFALERYMRIHNSRTIKFNLNQAYRRYNYLFKNLSQEIFNEQKNI